MKKKIIIFTIALLVIGGIVWGSNSANIKRYLWGTSTFLGDSTNYVVLNKGLLIYDSLVVGKDIYLGKNGGTLYLDSTRGAYLQIGGYALNLYNTKDYGSQNYYIGEKNSSYAWYKSSGSSSIQLLQLDTISGLKSYYNIQTNGGTFQVKFPSDTASDYNSDDAITLNKQTGTLTTKSLSTAGLGTYDLTLTNSLITTTSKVIAIMNGSLSAGVPIIQFAGSGSGTSTIRIYNAHTITALNNTITISFLVCN